MRRQIRAKCLWPLVFGLLGYDGLNAASSAISVTSDRSERLTLRSGDSVDVRAINSSSQNQVLVVSRQAVDVSIRLREPVPGHLSHPVLGYSSDFVLVAPNSELRLQLVAADALGPPGFVRLTIIEPKSNELAIRSTIELLQKASGDYRKGTRTSLRSAYSG